MNNNKTFMIGFVLAAMVPGLPEVSAAQAQYPRQLKTLQAEIAKALPTLDKRGIDALTHAGKAVKAAEAEANAAQQGLGKIQEAKALVDHAKGKWIGSAEKGLAQAEAALKKATTGADRKAAQQEIDKCQADKEAGLKALKERQEALDQASRDEPQLAKANQAAQAALAKARADELAAAKALLAKTEPFLASDKLDATLVKCVVLADSTPGGLAEFARQGREQEALVEKLLDDVSLMKEMLIAGGAKFGKYGSAMQIYTAIQQASPKAKEGHLQRLALATALEHAAPIPQGNAATETSAPATVDPVNRYLHYEKAWLDGELDPAFKDLTTWEYRMVVDCDAPDEILAWGREMLRNYRPDHIENPDYGWRYSGSVRTDVPYGSQNVGNDLPSLHQYQNIIRNGGVCGRRAFFGRFILRSFGIPVWGVTQHKHAALSHWTPKGWVVNLGAGFHASWWDKGDVSLSGTQFLIEAQAREHAADYLKVLRAQWASKALGEEAYNERKKVDGGFWSATGHHLALDLASKAVELGPLGEELGEANESPEATTRSVSKTRGEDADGKIVVDRDGVITIPAAACGGAQLMKSFLGGQQIFSGQGTIHCDVSVPRAGKYLLTARVASVQDSPYLQLTTKKDQQAVEIAVPYTMGKWEQTTPVEVSLVNGRNSLLFTRPAGSRGLAIKDFTLTPEGVVGQKKTGVSDSARPSGRIAREALPDRLAVLDELLLGMLAELSAARELKPLPMSISKARSRIWLAQVGSGAKLVFQAMEGSSQASFGFGELTAEDRAMLARLVAALRPHDADAQGAAGIYMEVIGQTDVADEYFRKAGPDFQEKLGKWFK